MTSRARLGLAVLAAGCVLAPSLALGARVVTLASGSMVTASMNQTIDSGSAHAGQHFTMSVVTPYPQGSSAFSGAKLDGHITNVVPAGQGKNPELEFAIDRIVLANGDQGQPELVVNAAQTQRHDNTAKIAMGALAGMIVGNIVGKTVFRSSAGGTLGLIAGALYAANNRTNVSLRQGSQVVFEARRTVALR